MKKAVYPLIPWKRAYYSRFTYAMAVNDSWNGNEFGDYWSYVEEI